MYSLGADPEFFLEAREKATGEWQPQIVCGLLGGTKDTPLPLGIGKGFAVQEDNVMAEYNVPPSSRGDDLRRDVQRGLHAVLAKVRGMRASPKHAIDFPVEELLLHPGAMMFGCSPDFDAYNNGAAAPPINPETLVYTTGGKQYGRRFAGGHVHLGYERHNEIPGWVAARLCDAFLGLRSVLDGDRQLGGRRELYGQPGRFRPTPYGIEYRTLSNYWVVGSEDQTDRVCYCAERVAYMLDVAPVEMIRDFIGSVPWGDVRNAIADEDMGMCEALLVHINQNPLSNH